MITQAQIEALQKNEKPMCFMDSELREIMLGMKPADFRVLQDTSTKDKPGWDDGVFGEEWHPDVNGYNTFHLRDDYKQEPSIVESKIFTDPDGLKCSKRTGVSKYKNMMLSDCINDPGFIGFKFEDGQVHTAPILYTEPCTSQRYEQLKSGGCKARHATHVLFQEAGK